MDFNAHGQALAARFSATYSPAPGTYRAIRYSTNYLPAALGPLPCVLVKPTEGDLVAGNGKRESGEEWTVTFYFAETGTPEKDYEALQNWLGVLVDATKLSVQLDGLVELALVTGWRMGAFSYGGKQYSGIELSVHIEAHESWLATA